MIHFIAHFALFLFAISAGLLGPEASAGPHEAPAVPPSGQTPEAEVLFLPRMQGGAHLGAGSTLLLNEVLFQPEGNAMQYVELVNSGATPLLAGGALLENRQGMTYTLPAGAGLLAPAGVLLVQFDGEDRVEAGVVHAGPTHFLGESSGVLALYAPGRAPLDRVAWGPARADGVPTGYGGLIAPLGPGATLQRAPVAGPWSPRPPDEASPAAANSLDRVRAALPPDRSLFTSAEAALSWYPVAGAERYQVQLAADASFATLLDERMVQESQWLASPLAPGDYHWRVRPLFAGGSVGVFSPSYTFTVAPDLAAASAQIDVRLLPVPHFCQRKDTSMLLVDEPCHSRGGCKSWDIEIKEQDAAGHVWDAPHPTTDPFDPADNMNCALASMAMINKWHGGAISQDRLGFEQLSQLAPPGPEGDLNWGRGMNVSEIRALTEYSLGAEARFTPRPDDPVQEALWPDTVFSVAMAEIDAGRPLLVANKSHAMVVTGYALFDDGRQRLIVNDPWCVAGRRSYWIVPDAVHYYWGTVGEISARSQEKTLTDGLDSDGDGILDFDEPRFVDVLGERALDPAQADTDGDGVPDKADVRAGVFDYEHGLAHGLTLLRDYDGDFLPPELDYDSDGGGCLDSQEDRDADGVRKNEAGESSNFDATDDHCLSLSVGTPENYERPTALVGAWIEVDYNYDGGAFGHDYDPLDLPYHQTDEACGYYEGGLSLDADDLANSQPHTYLAESEVAGQSVRQEVSILGTGTSAHFQWHSQAVATAVYDSVVFADALATRPGGQGEVHVGRPRYVIEVDNPQSIAMDLVATWALQGQSKGGGTWIANASLLPRACNQAAPESTEIFSLNSREDGPIEGGQARASFIPAPRMQMSLGALAADALAISSMIEDQVVEEGHQELDLTLDLTLEPHAD